MTTDKIILPPKPEQDQPQPSTKLCPFTSFTVPVIKKSSLSPQQQEVGLDVKMLPCTPACMLFNHEENACILWCLYFQANELIDGIDALNAATVPSSEEALDADGGVNAGGPSDEPTKKS